MKCGGCGSGSSPIFGKLSESTGTISLSALSDWLIERGDTPLDKVQELFNSLDTDGNGSIDRQEWRVGFTAGLLPK